MGPGTEGLADCCPDGEPPGEAELTGTAEDKALFCSSPTLLGASTVWRLSQVLLSGREAGGKGQGSVAHRIVAGVPPTQVPFPQGQQRPGGD